MNRHHKGFNLIELMVATVISVSLTSVAAGLLVRSIQSGSIQKNLAELNESTQFIAEFIRHEFYMAGYGFDQPIDWSRSDDGTKYDQVAVQRVAGVNDYDCSGASLTVGQHYTGIFSAKTSAGLSDLFCDRVIDGDDKNAESLIYGVERFQVLYGLEKRSGSAVGYVFMSKKQIETAAIPLADRHVVSIKIGVLLTDTGQAVFPRKSETFQVLDQTYDSAKSANAELNDGHFHRVVEWTIPLRNVSREIKI